jgi:putative ABC transport system permease protein
MGMESSDFQKTSSIKGDNPGKMHSYTALWEAFCIAIDSIWTHKLRSILTLLGIIIGVASVVTVAGAIGGLSSSISQRLSSAFASNTFLVARFARMNVSAEEWEKLIKRNKNIYPDDMTAVEDKCEGCEAVSPMIRGTDQVKRGSRTFFDASVSGVNADLPRIQTLDLAEGRFISNFDVSHARNYAVIGSQIREELFGPIEAIGKEIKLGDDSFTVVGVEVRNGSMMGQSLDNKVYIPYTAFLKKYGLHRSIQFQVRAPSDATLETAQDEVRQILRSKHKLRPSREDDFDILASSAVQDMVGNLTGTIQMIVLPITCVSLLVGGIVVMNIMLVVVTERTVEIGTRKAMGARRSDILLQFLVESALLAATGGALGILLSYALSLIIEAATSMPMHISLFYVVLAILFSGGIGIISGIYPAYKASKLNPIVALMRE